MSTATVKDIKEAYKTVRKLNWTTDRVLISNEYFALFHPRTEKEKVQFT